MGLARWRVCRLRSEGEDLPLNYSKSDQVVVSLVVPDLLVSWVQVLVSVMSELVSMVPVVSSIVLEVLQVACPRNRRNVLSSV